MMMDKMVKKTLLLAVLASCAMSAQAAKQGEYKAHLTAVNADKIGTSPVGDATFKVEGDKLVVHIKMKNTPPGIMHWEHFHGYPNGQNASCVTAAQDKNGDGFIDLAETEAVSGTTMVPFDDAPHKMNIPTDNYPHADKDGSYEYTKVVPLAALEKKFGETFKGGKIDLNKRVLYVHGVPDSLKLPATVAGEVGHYTTSTTLPIACGKIEKVKS